MVTVGCAVQRTYTPLEAAYVERAYACPFEVTVPKEEAEAAWNRVHVWVGSYSRMKVQMATEYLIQTFTPPSNAYIPYYGYSAVKELLPDGGVKISVQCYSNNMFAGKAAAHNAHLFALYIMTGEVQAHLLYQ